MPPLNHLEADVDTQSHLLFEAAQIPMLIINPATGEIIDANKAAIKYYGYSKSEFDSLKVSDLNGLSENEIFSEMELAAKQKRNHFFFIHRLSNGELRDVEVHSGVIKSDNKRYLYSIIHDITDRRAAEAELAELNRDFITLLENTSDFISFKSRDNSFKFCSQALADITGHESWRDMRGKKNNDIFPSNIAKTYLEEERLIFKSGKPILNKIYPYQNIKGEAGWISTNKWPVFDEEKVAIGAFEISRDVTLEQENQKQLQVAANVFHKASEGLMITDTEGNIIQVNEAFCILSGYSSKEIIGRTPSFLTSGHHDKTFFESMWKTLLLNKSWKGDIWNRQKDGGLFASRTSINAVTDGKGDVINYIGSFTDITLQLRHFEEIKHMAFHDALTGLPNRILLHDRLGQALKQADRQKSMVAVCFLDLDKFKPVNDNYGHKTGDLLLVNISQRIQKAINDGDTLARIGGDEFALILTGLTDINKLKEILQRVLNKCSTPFDLPPYTGIKVSASIGVSLYPNQKATAEQLIKAADEAMYQAKKSGRDMYYLYAF